MATHAMERLNLDFKGPLPSSTKKSYFLCIVDEYSRYPFCFPCSDTSASTIIACLEKVFSLFGTCNYIHSDRGSSLMSKRLKEYLLSKGDCNQPDDPLSPTRECLMRTIQRYHLEGDQMWFKVSWLAAGILGVGSTSSIRCYTVSAMYDYGK